MAPASQEDVVPGAMQKAPLGPSQGLVDVSATLRALTRGPPVAAGSSDAGSFRPAREDIAYAFHWLLTSVAEHRPLLLLMGRIRGRRSTPHPHHGTRERRPAVRTPAPIGSDLRRLWIATEKSWDDLRRNVA